MSATASLSCHAKVICALALCDADALATLLAEPGVRDAVHSMDVPAPVAARLAAGDCVSACRRRHPRWLLLLESAHLQQAVLRMLLARSLQGVLRSGYELGGVLVLLAAMVGAADALGHFAASLQAGRLPAEYRQLAEDVVATACMAPDAEGGVLRCLVRLAAAAAKGLQPAGPLAAHLGSELAACLSGAAQEGRLGELAALLAAGVLVTPEALRAAIAGGSEEVLALLLRHGTPPAEPLPAGTILTLPSGGGGVGGRCQYTCPLLFLLGAHAAKVSHAQGSDGLGVAVFQHRLQRACLPSTPIIHPPTHPRCQQSAHSTPARMPPSLITQGHEALHPQDLAMAELLVAAGYSPSSYSSVLVRGEEEAWLAPHLCPALQDEGLDVRGRGR